MGEKCQFLSLHASYLPKQVLKTSLVGFDFLSDSKTKAYHLIEWCSNSENPSAIDSESIEPLSVLHSKLKFEW